MYNTYYYNETMQWSNLFIWMIISFVIAVAGGILVYCLFLNKSEEKRLTKFGRWVSNLLHFKILLSETLLKILYIVSTLYLTLVSFGYIGQNFLTFILLLTIGNVVLRIIYEFLIVNLLISKNTTQINDKIKNEKI